MIWECSKCGAQGMEDACLGNSRLDGGCPECGCVLIWFLHLAYPTRDNGYNTYNERVLLNVKKNNNKVLRRQRVIPIHQEKYRYEDVH